MTVGRFDVGTITNPETERSHVSIFEAVARFILFAVHSWHRVR
jgi:hypothetical protein